MVDHPPTLARPASLTGALGYSVTNCTSDTNDAPSYGVYAHPGLTLVRRTQIYVAPSTNDPSGFPKPLHPSLRPSPQEQSGRAPARWYPALTCLYPVKCWPAIPPARGIVFNPSKTWRDKIDKPMFIACRQCQGCRVDHSKEWGLRCHHESKLHKQNCCLTLTYDNDHFPKTGSISLVVTFNCSLNGSVNILLQSKSVSLPLENTDLLTSGLIIISLSSAMTSPIKSSFTTKMTDHITSRRH